MLNYKENVKEIELAMQVKEENAGTDLQLLKDTLTNLNDARNELCYHCGKYKNSHRGACNDCRWKW